MRGKPSGAVCKDILEFDNRIFQEGGNEMKVKFKSEPELKLEAMKHRYQNCISFHNLVDGMVAYLETFGSVASDLPRAIEVAHLIYQDHQLDRIMRNIEKMEIAALKKKRTLKKK